MIAFCGSEHGAPINHAATTADCRYAARAENRAKYIKAASGVLDAAFICLAPF